MLSSVLSLLALQAAAGNYAARPKLRAPELELAIHASAEIISIEVTNRDTIPLTLVADAHLLALDITEPKPTDPKKARHFRPKTIRCALPLGIRPSNDGARQLVIPPGASYKENLDARFLCFTQKEHAALVENAIVVGRLGFVGRVGSKPKKTATKGSAIVRDASEATTFPLAEIGSSPITISTAAAEPHDASNTPLSVELSRTIDVATSFEAPLQVSLKNEQKQLTHIRLKPEALRLTVYTPEGKGVPCDVVAMKTNPLRELYATLGSKGKVSFTASLSSICPHNTFESQGLYRMIGSYDTSRWRDDNERAHAFSGRLDNNAPNGTWIRIRQGKHPLHRSEPTLAAPETPTP